MTNRMNARATERARLRDILGSRSGLPILAVNVNDQQDLCAAVEAANQARSPIILLVSARAIAHSGLSSIVALHRAVTANSAVPVWLELDHANDLALIEACVAAGFDIVMADFSAQPVARNLRSTRDVVGLAHAAGVLVEGDVTPIPDDAPLEELERHGTSPGDARAFALETGVDLLAVSVGNVHGFARDKPRIRVDLVRSIVDAVSTPLVLHGADYCSSRAIGEAAAAGIAKFNFGPEFREAYCVAVRAAIADCDWHAPDHRLVLNAARAAVRDAILRRFADLDLRRGAAPR